MKPDTLSFSGIRQARIDCLGISQLYISCEKLRNVLSWFDPRDLSGFAPLPVHDFGNGRLTLTDGHTRAVAAGMAGLSEIPIVYDMDDIITAEIGQIQYKEDIIWCDRFHLRSPVDLKERIISPDDYRKLWDERCDLFYNLLSRSTEEQRAVWSHAHEGLFLYGADETLTRLYFEDETGKSYTLPRPTE